MSPKPHSSSAAFSSFQARHELAVREHLRRHVHRDRERLGQRGPLLEPLRDAVEHEPSDRHDHARALRERNEIARRNESTRLSAPTHERFDAADAARGNLDLRLEIDLELVLRDGVLELALELPQRRLLLSRIRPVDVERELVLARFLQRELGAPEQRRCIVGVRRIHGDSERDVHEERVAAHFDLRRMILGEPNRGIHDGRHRVDVEQHGEAPLRQPDDRRPRRQRVAKLLRVRGAERLALVVPEGRRDAVERVELPEQQADQAALLPLLEELLDEANAGASVLTRARFFLRRAHSDLLARCF